MSPAPCLLSLCVAVRPALYGFVHLLPALQVRIAVEAAKLVQHETWIGKVIQLYETWLVRHGIMITGPTGGGKSAIFNVLSTALSVVKGQPFKIVRSNPKSFTSQV